LDFWIQNVPLPNSRERLNLTSSGLEEHCGMKIKGTIATQPSRAEAPGQPQTDIPRWTFLLGIGNGTKQISCLTSVRFTGTPPKAGMTVEVCGDDLEPWLVRVDRISSLS
jgi:hypothetical protein